MKTIMLNTLYLICLSLRSALRGLIALVLAGLVLPGCVLSPEDLPDNTDGTKQQQTSSHEQSNSQQSMTLKITPPELPDYRPSLWMPQPTNLLNWGMLTVQTPQTSSVTLSTGRTSSTSSDSQNFIQTAWEVAQDVPATVWTYGFIGVGLGVVVAVGLSGYRIVGLCISGASVLAMVAIALVYRHGEVIAYAVAGLIGVGGLAAVIFLFFSRRKERSTTESLNQVVSGCSMFLKDNNDTTAAELFKKSQFAAQDSKTRERVRKAK